MIMNEIIIATVILSALGLFFGVGLSIASKIFAVTEDERVAKIRALLPGANCGACGYPGCDGLAVALVEGKARVLDCPVGGETAGDAIAEVLGLAVEKGEKMVARVLCKGDCDVSRDKFSYDGLQDCVAAAQIFGGSKSCRFGCLGYGNCQRACPFGAIDMIKGLAVVDEARCKSCGLCVAACPKALIEMAPMTGRHFVFCKSKDKGAATKKACDVGCIGCTRCFKTCKYGAIRMEGPLAIIDPCVCTNCGECVPVCPTHSIVRILAPGETAPTAVPVGEEATGASTEQSPS
ncbi:MAG TPA: RnfABCDGE type electron transport complex subunit B [Spirochaetota bacterium]|nr:RnfABCDGE type electron transport complex subunit B [Spirochaetota bacterium]